VTAGSLQKIDILQQLKSSQNLTAEQQAVVEGSMKQLKMEMGSLTPREQKQARL
jgi:hypothetical protein